MTSPKFQATTKGVSVERVESFWKETIRAAGIGGDIVVTNPDTFSAQATQYEFGKIGVGLWRSSAYQVSRSRRDCAHSPTFYSIGFVKKGRISIEQSGRTAKVNQGDCVLLSSSDPSIVQFGSSVEMLTARIPVDWVKNWIPVPQDATAITFSKHSRWGNALAATLAAIDPASLDLLALSPRAVIEQVGSLLALAYGPADTDASGSQDGRLQRFRSALRDHFHDPDFSPSVLAEEQGIAKRTLHALFAAAGSSFGTELMSLRVETARGFLDDRRYDKKTIGEIARRVGFTTASHFISRFRQAYGITPLVYRSIRQS